MMCCGENRGKSFWIKRAIFIPIGIAACVFLCGWVVMLLWNCILPPVLGVSTVTFWQALGILVLSKLLFGGFKGAHGHSRFHHGYDMHHKWMHMSREDREKWMHMTAEEKDKMRAEWKEKCGMQAKQE
jgi:Ca2+/H+ antiporter, TMEM165/GDT1 family